MNTDAININISISISIQSISIYQWCGYLNTDTCLQNICLQCQVCQNTGNDHIPGYLKSQKFYDTIYEQSLTMKVTEFTGEVKALTSLSCTITVTDWFNINHQSIFYPNRGDFNYIKLIEVSVWMRIEFYQFVFHIFSKLCWL